MNHASRSLAVLFGILLAGAPVLDAQDAPPSLRYGPSRTSKDWVETSRGKEAVDDGVEWKGVKVYLSLMWNLIATDAASGKVLWTQHVGGFWNEIGFKEVETAGVKSWAVELRPGLRSNDDTAKLRQYHDLKTGKRVGEVEDAPSGNRLPMHQWSGHELATPEPVFRLVGTEAEWKAAVESLFAGIKSVPAFGTIDFAKSSVLVIAKGQGPNNNGIDAVAWEDDRRVLVRLHNQSFQTASFGDGRDGDLGKYDKMRPYGVFVVPKRDPFKTIIVERNKQNLIGGPAIWVELVRFDAPGEGKAATRPARTPR
jgi:hypothetical protein